MYLHTPFIPNGKKMEFRSYLRKLLDKNSRSPKSIPDQAKNSTVGTVFKKLHDKVEDKKCIPRRVQAERTLMFGAKWSALQ